MNIDLTGRVALVCGASHGIGAACARELAKANCTVLALARREEKLKDLIAELKALSKLEHSYLALDVAEHEQLDKHIKNFVDVKGAIHILVNNSGGPAAGAVLEADDASFKQAFSQHVLSAQHLANLVMPGMQQANFGRIINVISTSVKIPIKNLGVSNTIRGAMASWAKSLANEVGPHGITVNNILPGFTKTPRLDNLLAKAVEKTQHSIAEQEKIWQQTVPVGRFAEPEEIAYALLFLASSYAGYINGVSLPVDGGRTGSL